MKYFGIGLTIYMVVNVVIYFYVYSQTKDMLEEPVHWDGWFNKVANTLIASLLTIPAIIYYYFQTKLEKNID